MNELFETGTKSAAVISECGQYRYSLSRVWNDELPIMVFVMLNPSTADASQDDPTIRRCLGFARRDGFGGIVVRNVFALRATDPKELLRHPDPRGPLNDQYLLSARNVSLLTRLVAAWGTPFGGNRLSTAYKTAICACTSQRAYCLGTTKDGHPRHPLFVRGDAKLELWR